MMKTVKILLAGLFALACIQIASAQTFLRLTGSTTFRKATYNAIVNSLNAPRGACIGGTLSDMSGVLQAVITGTLKSGPSAGQAVVIQTAFGGSVSGVHVLTASLTTIPGASFDSVHTWISTTTNTLTALTVNGDGTISGATILVSPVFDAASTAQAANSDTNQSTTIYRSPTLLQENPSGEGIGVTQFYWLKGRQSPNIPAASYNAFVNMTRQAAGLIVSAGEVPLSFFTGNAGDSAYDVVMDDLSADSGARLDMEAEITLGLGANQTEAGYQPVIQGSFITSLTFVADTGHSDDAAVVLDLKTPIAAGVVDDNGKPFILVSHLGKPDKNAAVFGGAVVLTFAGVSNTDTNIENGPYSFWSYEHFYYKSGLATIQQNALNAISLQLRTTDVVNSGLLLTTMNVARVADGSAPQ